MKKALMALIFVCFLQNLFSQNISKFSIEANYGLNGNFFVRDYDEIGGPDDKKYFYKKDFLGTIGGIAFTYLFNQRNGVFLGFDKSVNTGKKNYVGEIGNFSESIPPFQCKGYQCF